MTKPDSKELRQFGLLLAVVIALLWFFIAGTARWPWLAAIAALLLVLAFSAPAALRPVHWLLMKFGHAVSKVLNRDVTDPRKPLLDILRDDYW